MSQAAQVYTIHYTLKDSEGEVLESSIGDEPMSFLAGVGQVIPGLEKQLAGLKMGDKKLISVVAAEAYGEYDDDLVAQVPRAQFPKKDIEVGEQFQTDAGGGQQVVVVTELSDEFVTIDGNHPLAGEDLQFDIEVLTIRDATKDELAHGHAHGPGGAHH
jgi:FKBP-type peptidyl-prolyl cis-trans isomerase SlyD